MTEESRENDPDRSPVMLPDAAFIRDFTRFQRPVFLFVLSQVPNPVEAEEILQETNIVIWKKFAAYEPGTNFLAWACQIARFEVLKFLDRNRRDRHYFNDDLMDKLAAEALESADEWDLRREALSACLQKLRAKDRELIQQRYSPEEAGHTLGEQTGRPMNSIYQSLGRIRRTLHECIQRYLTAVEAGL
jgi:RNA polymerase sigma-70 factor (ECF subfamily)